MPKRQARRNAVSGFQFMEGAFLRCLKATVSCAICYDISKLSQGCAGKTIARIGFGAGSGSAWSGQLVIRFSDDTELLLGYDGWCIQELPKKPDMPAYVQPKYGFALACDSGHVHIANELNSHCAYCGLPLSVRPVLMEKIPANWRGRIIIGEPG